MFNFGFSRLFAIGYVAILCGAPMQTAAQQYDFELIAEGFDTPWAFGFLPDGSLLVTERDGKLLYLSGANRVEVSGLPEVETDGQGGLLDVLIPRDFNKTRDIYLTYVVKQGWRGAGTALMRGTLSSDGQRLDNVQTLFEMSKGSSGGRHFGSRLVEAPDGSLLMTLGDRADRDSAQDLSRHNGSILRLDRNGKPAAGNPFVGAATAQPEIWSFGHRNPQGLAVDPEGQLWAVEHGARGGDELNKLTAGANFGWPVISYGVHYSGFKIGEGQEKDGMEQPEHYWDPSIAPSGLAFHDGRGKAEWAGDAFVGSLKFDYIARMSGKPMLEVEQISGPETERVRDVRQGPNGAIWFLSVGNGALFRIAQ